MKFYIIIFLSLFINISIAQSSKDTEIWEPIPKKVYSISDSSPPDDAIVLFDGTDMSNWEARWGSEMGWQKWGAKRENKIGAN